MVIDYKKIIELNPYYFYAASERNEKRLALLSGNNGNPGPLKLFVDAANEFQAAKAKMKEVLEYECLHVVSYGLQKLIDWET